MAEHILLTERDAKIARDAFQQGVRWLRQKLNGWRMTDEKRYIYLRDKFVAADFRDEQFPRHVVLKFALPIDTKVSSDIDATIDAAIANLESLG